MCLTTGMFVLFFHSQRLQQTVQVDTKALLKLTQSSLENNIEELEEAATQLYKALQAGRDRGGSPLSRFDTVANGHPDMAATMERLEEYRTYNMQFCKRLFDFLKIMCDAQVRRQTELRRSQN